MQLSPAAIDSICHQHLKLSSTFIGLVLNHFSLGAPWKPSSAKRCKLQSPDEAQRLCKLGGVIQELFFVSMFLQMPSMLCSNIALFNLYFLGRELLRIMCAFSLNEMGTTWNTSYKNTTCIFADRMQDCHVTSNAMLWTVVKSMFAWLYVDVVYLWWHVDRFVRHDYSCQCDAHSQVVVTLRWAYGLSRAWFKMKEFNIYDICIILSYNVVLSCCQTYHKGENDACSWRYSKCQPVGASFVHETCKYLSKSYFCNHTTFPMSIKHKRHQFHLLAKSMW